ncbi:hypothetical protein [Roseibium sp. Sym1]|uniref:phosphoribosylanthranilate isomerase n=1 Tax=Roseibium sp. Sym1 TaxID=3016006 RepID=UPI0022B47755|nr:hypothetical protein [Roseibium sp. Sym1]
MDIKICGATTLEEIELLQQEGARYTGLWTGIDGHRYNLDDTLFHTLADRCRRIIPVAVCVRKPVAGLVNLLKETRVRHVQLHGFNAPRDVALLKQAGYTVIKTLHLKDDGSCLEERWIEAYAKLGTDIFLADRYQDPSRIGSTGQPLPDSVAEKWMGRLAGHRIWLAGGLNVERVSLLSEGGRVETADIDTAARHLGKIARKASRLLVTASRPAGLFKETA